MGMGSRGGGGGRCGGDGSGGSGGVFTLWEERLEFTWNLGVVMMIVC